MSIPKSDMNIVLKHLLERGNKLTPSNRYINNFAYSDDYVSDIYREIKRLKPNFIQVNETPGKYASTMAQIFKARENEINAFLANGGFHGDDLLEKMIANNTPPIMTSELPLYEIPTPDMKPTFIKEQQEYLSECNDILQYLNENLGTNNDIWFFENIATTFPNMPTSALDKFIFPKLKVDGYISVLDGTFAPSSNKRVRFKISDEGRIFISGGGYHKPNSSNNPVPNSIGSVYYQIVIDLEYFVQIPGQTGGFLYEFDLTDLNGIENNQMKPFLNNQTFIIDGYPLKKEQVVRFRIMKSNNTTRENIKLATKNNPNNVISKEDIVGYIDYYTEITSEVHNKVQQKINAELAHTATKTNFIPHQLIQSVDAFRKTYPEKQKTAFIMMQFKKTNLHDEIVRRIKEVLMKHSIIGLRADDKELSDDLFNNIRTYMHSADFGIAVFERISSDDFNPNISLEVGYMMGLGKDICLLKDQTIKSLHSDLVGKLYKPFDLQDLSASLTEQLEKWMRDKNII